MDWRDVSVPGGAMYIQHTRQYKFFLKALVKKNAIGIFALKTTHYLHNRSAKKYFTFTFTFLVQCPFDLLTVSFQGQTFLTVHDHRGPICSLHRSLHRNTTKTNHKRVFVGQIPPKKIWPWTVTVSRSNKPTPTFQEKNDIYICRSLTHTFDEVKCCTYSNCISIRRYLYTVRYFPYKI